MAVVKLSDTLVFEDYAQVFDASNVDDEKESPPLDGLTHFSFPGLTWRVQLYPRGDSRAMPGYTSVYVSAYFGSEKVSNVWAEWILTVVSGDAKATLQESVTLTEYLSGGPKAWGFANAFLQEELNAAVRSDGHLEMKFDLALSKVGDLLNCRETVRALLTDNRHMDIAVNADGTTFNAHKAILAKVCNEFTGSIPDRTTAAAFSAFLGCAYCDRFDFGSSWELSRDVLRMSDELGAGKIKEFCDEALAVMVPTLELSIVLEILPESIRRDALRTNAACIQVLAEKEDILTSTDWINFMKASEDVSLFQTICNGLLKRISAGRRSAPDVYFTREVIASHTWSISSTDLPMESVPRPSSVVTSPPFLQHKAFAGLEWQLEFHPQGNADDPDYQPGFTSLYLKASFDPANNDVKAVYAKWKATIMVKDKTQVSIPDSSEFTLYTDRKSMTFGYANAFTLEQYNESRAASKLNLEIRLDLTFANVYGILDCHTFISSFHSDKTHADFEVDVNDTIFKVHKFILAARSTVFAQMFEADMAESKSGKVEVKETTPEAFEAFLAGVYYASWTFLSDMDATIDVLNLAERYAVADLKRYCDESLAHFANASNLLTILPYAVAHNAEATKAACVGILFSNPNLVKSPGWIQFKREAKKEVMADIAEALGELYRKERKHRDCAIV